MNIVNYCFNSYFTKSSPTTLIDVRRDELSWFLRNGDFDSQKLIDQLKENPKLKALYAKSAGVGEGYSIEVHTKRVLDVFALEFCQGDEVPALLERVGLTFTEFALFLALHDIGKGLAVDKGYLTVLRTADKDVEFEKTAPVLVETMEEHGVSPEKTRIFLDMLCADSIGEVLKKPHFKEVIEKAAHHLQKGQHHGLSTQDFFHLMTLFHAIDASSYPTVRHNYFASSGQFLPNYDDDLKQLTGHSERQKAALQELAETLQCQPLDLSTFLQPSAEGQHLRGINLLGGAVLTSAQVYKIVLAKRAWKSELIAQDKDPGSHPLYQAKRLIIKDLKNSKAAFRFSHFLTTNAKVARYLLPEDNHKQLKQKIFSVCQLNNVYDFFTPHTKPSKLQREAVLQEILTTASTPEVAKHLQTCEEFIAYHGSNSAVMAMMVARQDFVFERISHLRKKGVAPLSGEGGTGITRYGFNANGVSFCPSGAMEHALSYALTISKDSTPSSNKIKQVFKDPYPTSYGGFLITGDDLHLVLQRLYLHAPEKFKDEMKKHYWNLSDSCDKEIHGLKNLINANPENGQFYQKSIESWLKVKGLITSKNPHLLVDSKVVEESLTASQQKVLNRLLYPGEHLIDTHQTWEILLNKMLSAQQWDADSLYSAFEAIQPAEKWVERLSHHFKPIKEGFETFKGLLALELAENEKKQLVDYFSDPKSHSADAISPIGSFTSEQMAEILTNSNPYDRKSMRGSSGLDVTLWPAIYRQALNHLILGEDKKLEDLENEMTKEFNRAHLAYSLLDQIFAKRVSNGGFSFPKDASLRQLVTKPFPVLFALTALNGEKRVLNVRDNESLFKDPLPLGSGGIQHIFTDTEAHRQQIIKLLPEAIRADVKVGLFGDLSKSYHAVFDKVPLVSPSWMLQD